MIKLLLEEFGAGVNVKDKDWVERIDRTTFYFVEIARTSDFVDLKNKTAPTWIRLRRNSCEVRFGNQPFKVAYLGRWDR